MGEVADYLGVESGRVGITDFDSGRAEPSIHAHGLDDDPLFNIWIDEFGFENPWTDGVPPLTQGQIVTGTETVPPNDFRGLPLYPDVFSTLEIEDTLVAALSTEGARVLFLAVYCDRAHGPISAERLPLTCWAIPTSNRSETGLARLVSPGDALLFVGDPDRRPELASETVARLFGLTPAEARVAAAIAAGETPREYAERLNLKLNTVRWTLKQVLAKLGARRQLDVARIVTRAVPGLGG